MLTSPETAPGRFTPRYALNAALFLVLFLTVFPNAHAGETHSLLLIYQGPDGHPASTHEYKAGLRVLEGCLQGIPNLEIQSVAGNGDWAQGPEILAEADAAVLFVSQGAKWIADHPRLQDAFSQLAQRGGGLGALHWATGTKSAEPIAGFVYLFGGCHGGPDRKYTVVETDFAPATPGHVILRGVEPLRVSDEFYYRLKFPLRTSTDDGDEGKSYGQASDEQLAAVGIQPLIKVDIGGDPYTVAWAWERPDGGRSFGFTGLHFHKNWQLDSYRRLVAQATLWSLGLPIPAGGIDVAVSQELLSLSE